jgi:hypothetical protein
MCRLQAACIGYCCSTLGTLGRQALAFAPILGWLSSSQYWSIPFETGDFARP